MEFQPWRTFGLTTYQYSEDDKFLCRSLLKLLADQTNKQEYNINKDTWFDFCSNVLGRPYSDEQATQFLSRFPHLFAFTDLINDGEVLVKSNLALALCKDHLSKEGCHNSFCMDLHCCKFYLHDTCKFRDNCSFGHDLRRGRNNQILERYMLSLNWSETNGTSSDYHPGHAMTPKKFIPGRDPQAARTMPEINVVDLVQLLRQENPRICKFYNSEVGCKHGSDGRKCPALHLCKHYVKFGQCTDAYCNLCHDIRSPQPFSLLSRYGYEVSIANEQAILKQLQADEVVAGATPVKRCSPPVEQEQHYHHHQFHPSGFVPGMDLAEEAYGGGYYGGGALDFYESDDAAWSSQESRYCNDYQQMGYYATDYHSDCEGSVTDHGQPMAPYGSLKPTNQQLTHQNQYQQPVLFQVPSLIPKQPQTSQQPKTKEGELKVCQFYNFKGCRYGDGDQAAVDDLQGGDPAAIRNCQNLHLCNHYVNGACLYKSEQCKKSHDLHSIHTKSILERHDIDVAVGNDKVILDSIRQRISQQVIEMDDASPSSSSSMERLSLDDLDPADMKDTPRRSRKEMKKTRDEEDVLRTPHRINTFVFLDLEATGLELPRITEISLVSVDRADLEDALRDFSDPSLPSVAKHEYLPRVTNKLTLCVNPLKEIEPNVSKMTGLTNKSLMHQKDFDHGLVNILSLFLDRLPRPICLVAHNGLRFDFPLLQGELVSIGRHGDLPSDILCVDTLVMFRSFEEHNRQASFSAPIPDQPKPEPVVPSTNGVVSKKQVSNAEPRTDWWGLSDEEPEPEVPPKADEKVAVVPAQEDFKKKSFKLPEIHFRATGKYPEEMHRAEDDALALVRCFVFSPGSLKWADENAILLNGVTPLVLPKRKPYDAGVFPGSDAVWD